MDAPGDLGAGLFVPLEGGSKLGLVWEGHSRVVFLLWLYTHLSTPLVPLLSSQKDKDGLV